MTTAVPERSAEQRMAALRAANEIRLRRATLRQDLKTGRGGAELVILDPPKWAESMKVIDLLMRVPGWGTVKVDRAMFTAKVGHGKTLGGITQRQRTALVEQLCPPPKQPCAKPRPLQDRVLEVLVRLGGEEKASTLAYRAGIDPCSVRHALARLHDRGVVERVRFGVYRVAA